MNAVTKGQVAIGRARQVKPVGVGKDRFIPIGRKQRGQHRGPLRNGNAVERHLCAGKAKLGGHERAIVAQ